MVATAGEKVEIVVPVKTLQAFWHGLNVREEWVALRGNQSQNSKWFAIGNVPPFAKGAKDGPPWSKKQVPHRAFSPVRNDIPLLPNHIPIYQMTSFYRTTSLLPNGIPLLLTDLSFTREQS